MVTSLVTEDTPADCLDLSPADRRDASACARQARRLGQWRGRRDRALFFVHAAASGDEAFALSRAASSVFGLLRRTEEAGSREILTVAAQDEFVTPSRIFTPEAIA